MKNDPREIEALSTAQAPRLDMYSGIHKALRALMADTLLAVGRMDVQDEPELARTTQRVIELVEFCAGHLRHENEFVHPAIEARAPGASSAIAHDHEEHLLHIARLAGLAAALQAQPAATRAPAAQGLYRELALFIADNFQHMHVEETAHNEVLWSRYTDAELLAIHDALLASIPPDELMFTARWLIPFMSPAERVGLLGGMRAGMPPPAFDAVLQTVRPHMTDVEWGKLERALDLPSMPNW